MQDLHWHALNYRTADTLDAHRCWQELERYVRQAELMERERCAKICDAEASIEGIAQRCAAAIRAQG